jgi:hypothetical protein
MTSRRIEARVGMAVTSKSSSIWNLREEGLEFTPRAPTSGIRIVSYYFVVEQHLWQQNFGTVLKAERCHVFSLTMLPIVDFFVPRFCWDNLHTVSWTLFFFIRKANKNISFDRSRQSALFLCYLHWACLHCLNSSWTTLLSSRPDQDNSIVFH